MACSFVVFTRLPRPGQAKTRLIPALGEEGAAALQDRMTRLVVARTLSHCASSGGRLLVSCDGGEEKDMRTWLGPGPEYVRQIEGSLGERIHEVVAQEFGRGATRVIVMGSDCPRLSSKHMGEAEAALERAELVFGPAEDGGYYLVGLRRECAELFQGIPWGTSDVLKVSLRKAREMHLETVLLESLPDVDEAEDLADAYRALAGEERTVV